MSADTDPGQVGQVLFARLPGFILQRLLLGDVDVDGFTAGLGALLPAR